MNSRRFSLWLLTLAVVVVYLSCGVNTTAGSGVENATTTERLIDADGVVFQVSFYDERPEVVVEYGNPTDRNGDLTGFVIEVDGLEVYNGDLKLNSQENGSQTIRIKPGINVNRNKHTITFSTVGNYTQFNFTRQINSSSPGTIPTPYIADVTVENGTAKGKPSAVANVTVVNPSEQIYSTKLFVHTTRTEGSFYPASVRPGGSQTISVELLDPMGAKIGGEARLYTGNLTTREGAMDQVEFVGRAGESTSSWNVSYQPVRPTWMNDHYKYENDSIDRTFGEKISGGREIRGVPLAYFVAALFLVAGALWRVR